MSVEINLGPCLLLKQEEFPDEIELVEATFIDDPRRVRGAKLIATNPTQVPEAGNLIRVPNDWTEKLMRVSHLEQFATQNGGRTAIHLEVIITSRVEPDWVLDPYELTKRKEAEKFAFLEALRLDKRRSRDWKRAIRALGTLDDLT